MTPDHELEQSREAAERLLDNLAQKIGAGRPTNPSAIDRQQAAGSLHAPRLRDFAAGIERTVRKRPTSSLLVAILAGFLVGRAIRSR